MRAKIASIILAIFFLTGSEAFASSARVTEADSLISANKTKAYALPAATDTLVGRASTDTLTNKSVSGSTNTLSNLPVATQIQQETPSGTINGSNTAFTLAFTPVTTTSLEVYLDGLLLLQTTDYTLSTATITMTTAPALGQTLRAVYSKF